VTAHPSPDDLTGYALGALDPAAERSVSSHLPGCESCSAELRERINPAVGVLAESVEQLEPPPELRERLLEIVRSEAEAARPESAAQARRRRLRLGPLVLRPAAGLAVLAVAGAGVAGYLANEDDGGGGGTSTVPVTESNAGIGGSLVVAEDSATLSVHGMPKLPQGAVYQLWVAQGSTVRPSSSFVPDAAGRGTAAVTEPLPTGSRVLVTRESGPGHQIPSRKPLLSARVD
jgi:anti-sigma factor RsiW